jgi:hypothetical protein
MTDQMDLRRQIRSLHNEALQVLKETDALTEQVALKNAVLAALTGEMNDLLKKLEA